MVLPLLLTAELENLDCLVFDLQYTDVHSYAIYVIHIIHFHCNRSSFEWIVHTMKRSRLSLCFESPVFNVVGVDGADNFNTVDREEVAICIISLWRTWGDRTTSLFSW